LRNPICIQRFTPHPESPVLWTGCGVYFHLRKLIESSKTKKTKPFIYSEMPFSTKMRGEGKKNPRVDLAVAILDKETPIDLLAVIELKHYDSV